MVKPGIVNEVSFFVSPSHTASAVGSGTLDVLASPVLFSFMEKAAWSAVGPFLENGDSTVGTMMNVQHLSPTPVGMKVTCRAELTEVRNRTLLFQVTASDESGLIGSGTHERVIVQADRFLSKANRKRTNSGS